MTTSRGRARYLKGCRRCLGEGETAHVSGLGLTITVKQVGIGQPDSQRTDIGHVTLQVKVRGEGEQEISLETGRTVEVGEALILVKEVVSRAEDDGCVLIVSQ